MKKKFYLSLAVIVSAGLFISATFNSGGSPGAKTDSPLDGSTCTDCHSGSATNVNDWITTDIPGTGYVPGETYTITATGDHSGVVKFGFELTAEDGSSKTGTFTITDDTETQLTNGNQAVTHKSAGTTPSGNQKTWTVDWTAPSAGTGDVTFYAAFNAANGDGGTGGDVIYTSSTLVNEDPGSSINELSSVDITLYPNPANEFVSVSSNSPLKEISVFNSSGKLISKYRYDNLNHAVLHVNDLSKGIYFIKISGKKFEKTKRLVIR